MADEPDEKMIRTINPDFDEFLKIDRNFKIKPKKCFQSSESPKREEKP
jgi:hypothetical protein